MALSNRATSQAFRKARVFFQFFGVEQMAMWYSSALW